LNGINKNKNKNKNKKKEKKQTKIGTNPFLLYPIDI
jgi:hypothetical protein